MKYPELKDFIAKNMRMAHKKPDEVHFRNPNGVYMKLLLNSFFSTKITNM